MLVKPTAEAGAAGCRPRGGGDADHPITVQILVETGLEQFQRRARS